MDSLIARASRGDAWTLGEREITADVIGESVRLGGFVHPLFADPAHARASGFSSVPLPGQALLLLLGGLAEADPAFGDEVVAMLGYDHVEFRRAPVAGELLRAEVVLRGVQPWPRPGRRVVLARFVATAGGTLACVAEARFLVNAGDDRR